MLHTLMYSLDILGTAIFALTGAVKAIRHKLDILGVLVLSCIVGVGGGALRDCIIGSTPIVACTDETYLLVCIAVGFIVFFSAPYIVGKWRIVMWADAFGLGVFTVLGVAKGISMGLGPVGCVLSGVLTATGGGIIRDVLVREVPAILIHDFYATAALLGAILYLFVYPVTSTAVGLLLAGSVTIGLRLFGMHKKIQLPKAHWKGEYESSETTS